MGRTLSWVGWGLVFWTGMGAVSASAALTSREREALQVADAFVRSQGRAAEASALVDSLRLEGAWIPGREWRLLAYRASWEPREGSKGSALPEVERSSHGELLEACGQVISSSEWSISRCRADQISLHYFWDFGKPGTRAPRKTFVLGNDSVEGSPVFRSRLTALDQFAVEPFPLHAARELSPDEFKAWLGERGLLLPQALEEALQKRGTPWRVPEKGRALEASDFFGRRIVALWVPGEPWPRYVRSAAGVTIYLPTWERGQ